MSSSSVLKVLLVCALATGCTIGMGPSTAATRPLLGQSSSDDDAKMWVPSGDQSHVPAGMVRIEQVSDGFAQIFNYVSITSGTRKGSTTPTKAGTTGDARDVTVLDLSLTARIPLPVMGISLGAGRVWDFEGADTDLGGFGVRASVAPIGQLSIDFAHSWVHGSDKQMDGSSRDLSGTHTSVGGTLLLWGYNSFRWGVAIAKTWTSADPYTSTGYTWSLVGTMY